MSEFFRYSKHHRQFFEKHGESVTYKKGQYLVWSADESPWVFFLLEGYVQAGFSHRDGSEQNIGFFIPGMTFAQSGSFLGSISRNLEYVAINECKVLRIPRERFLQQIRVEPKINHEYLSALSRNQVYLIERIGFMGEKTVRMKLIAWLIFMIRFYGATDGTSCHIPMPMTQEDIANFLCVTRESVSNGLRELISEGLVTHTKKMLLIPDCRRLHAALR